MGGGCLGEAPGVAVATQMNLVESWLFLCKSEKRVTGDAALPGYGPDYGAVLLWNFKKKFEGRHNICCHFKTNSFSKVLLNGFAVGYF